jgi:oligopeptide/dipeptide ABC transporter ATP-binding protein
MSAPARSRDDALLEVSDLTVTVTADGHPAVAVDGVSLHVGHGEAVGLVGESGSGKSLTLRAILGLLPPGVSVTGGRVTFDGHDLLEQGGRGVRSVRGTGISMVFQEPMTALNPVVKVGEQMIDAARRRLHWRHAEARDHALQLARQMGISDPEATLSLYPHELSGGMRQRVMIAAALASRPKLILCDEPTTALDVTIQDQIMQLLDRLRDELAMSLLYVTHDLAVVAQLCSRVEVMYAGRILERGPLPYTFDVPSHPYTLGLLQASPDIDDPRAELYAIPGSAPGIRSRPAGCPFHPRCRFSSEQCTAGDFPLRATSMAQATACAFPERIAASVSDTALPQPETDLTSGADIVPSARVAPDAETGVGT